MESVAIKLENNIPKILRWLKLNSMVANLSKFQVIFLGIKEKSNLCIAIDGLSVKSGKEVKLLGVTIDNDLNFKSHIKSLCQKANQKISALKNTKLLKYKKTHICYVMPTLSVLTFACTNFREFREFWSISRN